MIYNMLWLTMKILKSYRLKTWQADEVVRIAKANKVPASSIVRLAISCLILRHKGKINPKTIDEFDFKARAKISL